MVEVFGYTCSHCARLEGLIHPWSQRLPADVRFTPVPAAFGGFWDPWARAYLAARQTGVAKASHQAVFAALHQQRLRLIDEKSMSEWFVKQGGDARKFADAYKSFGVMSKMKRAEQLGQAMRIDSVPTLVVEGKYRVEGKGFQQLLANTDALIAMSRKK